MVFNSTSSRFQCKYSTGCLLIHASVLYDVVLCNLLGNLTRTRSTLELYFQSDLTRLTGELAGKVGIRREIRCSRQDISIRVFSLHIDSQLPKLTITSNGPSIESRGRERLN